MKLACYRLPRARVCVCVSVCVCACIFNGNNSPARSSDACISALFSALGHICALCAYLVCRPGPWPLG